MNAHKKHISLIFSFLAIIAFTCKAGKCGTCYSVQPCTIQSPQSTLQKSTPNVEPIVKAQNIQKEVKPEIKQEPKKEEKKNEPKKMGGEVYSVSTINELNNYIETNDSVIIDIYASWCGPCKSFAPLYEEFSKKHPLIICLKADGEKITALKNKYKISSYPTFVLYKNKVKIEQFSGASQSVARFEERVKKLFP